MKITNIGVAKIGEKKSWVNVHQRAAWEASPLGIEYVPTSLVLISIILGGARSAKWANFDAYSGLYLLNDFLIACEITRSPIISIIMKIT
jgi:hypothetical protein